MAFGTRVCDIGKVSIRLPGMTMPLVPKKSRSKLML